MMSKKSLAIVLAVIMIASMLTGCGSIQDVTTEVSTEVTTSETTMPTETTAIENTEPTIPKIKFANEFDILNNENVEQVKVAKLTEIYDILDNNGFTDIDPFLNTKKETVHIGMVDGIIVGQFEVDLDNIVWNFRAEKAEKLENRTNLMIPEDAEKLDWSVDNYQIDNYTWFVGENSKGLIAVELDIAFCPDTKNLYTFYTKTVWEDNDEGYFENPSVRGPDTILMRAEYKSYIRQMGRYHTLDVVRVD